MIKLQVEKIRKDPIVYSFYTDPERFKKGRRIHVIEEKLVERAIEADYEWRWLQSFLKELK